MGETRKQVEGMIRARFLSSSVPTNMKVLVPVKRAIDYGVQEISDVIFLLFSFLLV